MLAIHQLLPIKVVLTIIQKGICNMITEPIKVLFEAIVTNKIIKLQMISILKLI